MSDPAKTRIPQLELDCLKVLWSVPEASVAEVRAAMPRGLAYTTVMTLLDRLHARGVVNRRKQGRAHVYSATLDLDTARRQAVERLVFNFFGSDLAALREYLGARGASVRPAAAAQATKRAERPAKVRKAVASVGYAPSPIDDSLL